MKWISRSRLLLSAALVATLLAAWFAPEKQEDEGVVLARSTRPQFDSSRPDMARNTFVIQDGSRKTAAAKSVEILRIRERQALENEEVSLFSAADWQQPEAIPSETFPLEEAPPPAPTAPPLSFRIMGRYMDGGQSVVFLQQAEQSWAVREGDTLDGLYKVEHIGHDVVQLRYLPLDEVQTLSVDDGAL
ncbi:MAG: hypothetical protein LBO79_10500 [Zoogloeaceae bacterium]|jgi:hypothetical protein|nr:hypothetical protein [Zoogloeaceae bacterium]